MQAIIGLLIALVLIGGGYYFFTAAPAPESDRTDSMMIEDAGVPAAGNYAVVASESEIKWEASKPLIPGYTHGGTLMLKDGTITIGENTASGSFTIDMNTIEVTSLGGGKVGQESALEGHLKNDDFFAVEEFPTATFTITSVTPTDAKNIYTVVGTLEMKGTTGEVTFPAQISEKDGALVAIADLTIDRTKWGITFGSADFVSNIANNAIGNDVTLSLNLVARKSDAMMEGKMEGDAMMKKEDGAMMEE